MNVTLKTFGYPDTLIKEYDYWALLLRPRQITIGSCVIAAKADVTSVADIGAAAGAEFITVIADFERALRATLGAVKFNYMALMMVDPNPHFHALPRYDRPVTFDGVEYHDAAFPGVCDLKNVLDVNPASRARLLALLTQYTSE